MLAGRKLLVPWVWEESLLSPRNVPVCSETWQPRKWLCGSCGHSGNFRDIFLTGQRRRPVPGFPREHIKDKEFSHPACSSQRQSHLRQMAMPVHNSCSSPCVRPLQQSQLQDRSQGVLCASCAFANCMEPCSACMNIFILFSFSRRYR